MTGDTQIDAAIAAAEGAAGAGDFAAAERYLRDAVLLQEQRLGTFHPDLANTLNNLGVACEQRGKLDEAEACYRRAYTIALEAFPPDHPFVHRSAANLRDFCEARGRPFDLPLPSPPAAATPLPAPPVEDLVIERVSSFEPPPAPTAQPGLARWLVPALLVVGVIVGLGWWRAGDTEDSAAITSTGVAPTSPSVAPTSPDDADEVPVDPASDAGPDGEPAVMTSGPAAATAAPPADVPSPGPAASGRTTSAPPSQDATPAEAAASTAAGDVAAPVVVRAVVCRNFSTRTSGADWSCDPVGEETTSGRLVFYTRIRSPRPVTIEHLWYRGTTLYQRVPLRVGANPGAGYRTYSQNTVPASGDGNWRVELRTTGGALLHEHHFTVR